LSPNAEGTVVSSYSLLSMCSLLMRLAWHVGLPSLNRDTGRMRSPENPAPFLGALRGG